MGFKLKNFKAALFDMDGTLVDSMWMWGAIDREIFALRNVPYDPNFQEMIEGMSHMDTIKFMRERFFPEDSVEGLVNEINDMARDKYEFEVKFKPGALEFLKELKNNSIPCGMSTSNCVELLDACDRNLHFKEYFSSIRTTNDLVRSKPFPDCYLLNAEDLNVDPEDCVVFEDIIPGIEAGRAAGMRVVAIEDQYSAYAEEKKREMADYYIVDYRELLEE